MKLEPEVLQILVLFFLWHNQKDAGMQVTLGFPSTRLLEAKIVALRDALEQLGLARITPHAKCQVSSAMKRFRKYEDLQ